MSEYDGKNHSFISLKSQSSDDEKEKMDVVASEACYAMENLHLAIQEMVNGLKQLPELPNHPVSDSYFRHSALLKKKLQELEIESLRVFT